jgi:hypothetical protein
VIFVFVGVLLIDLVANHVVQKVVKFWYQSLESVMCAW